MVWDFKNCDEKSWFRFLMQLGLFVGILYVLSHWFINTTAPRYSHEYTLLSKSQNEMITRLYQDTTNQNQTAFKQPGRLCCYTYYVPCEDRKSLQIMSYLDNVFDDKIDVDQRLLVQRFIYNANPRDVPQFLSDTRFKVRSYFWLVGPSVYWEIIFWALIGVISSLLFNLGVIGKNSTTDLGDSRTVFDASEIPYQLAKLFYAPACTLVVVLGYNFFSNENIVDISSSKGLIVFAFIGGFYSSRVIALMDRLKDVLLPSSATPSGIPSGKTLGLIPTVSIKISIDGLALSSEELNALGADWINSVVVKLKNDTNKLSFSASREQTDPPGVYTVTNLQPGTYTITASKAVTKPPVSLDLFASKTGMIASGKTAIELSLTRAEG